MRGTGEPHVACGDTAKRAAAACSLLGAPAAPSPRTAPAAMSGPASLQQGALRSAGRRPAWRPPAPLRAAAGTCPSAPASPSHWPPPPAGPAPSITGFTSTFSRALQCGSTTLRRPARVVPLAKAQVYQQSLIAHWFAGLSITLTAPRSAAARLASCAAPQRSARLLTAASQPASE